MTKSEVKPKPVLVSIRVISPFYVMGKVARAGEIVKLEADVADELIYAGKASKASIN